MIRAAQYSVFCVVFCRPLFIILSFFSLAIALSALLRFWHLQTFLICWPIHAPLCYPNYQIYFIVRDLVTVTCSGGRLWVFFRSEFFFRTTRELEYLFLLSRNFFSEFIIRLYDKNSESDYFFFLHQNQNIFLEKNHSPCIWYTDTPMKNLLNFENELIENRKSWI